MFCVFEKLLDFIKSTAPLYQVSSDTNMASNLLLNTSLIATVALVFIGPAQSIESQPMNFPSFRNETNTDAVFVPQVLELFRYNPQKLSV